jgi:hypothetical protein
MLFGDKDNNLADARMEQVFEAIKEHDKNAVRAIFSPKAITEADNFDAGVDFLLSFVTGEVVSWSRDESPVVSDVVENSRKTKQLLTWYTLETEEHKYLVFLVDYPIDTVNPENEGLYSLRIIREEDEENLVGTMEEWIIPGIYVLDDFQLKALQ